MTHPDLITRFVAKSGPGGAAFAQRRAGRAAGFHGTPSERRVVTLKRLGDPAKRELLRRRFT